MWAFLFPLFSPSRRWEAVMHVLFMALSGEMNQNASDPCYVGIVPSKNEEISQRSQDAGMADPRRPSTR